MVGVHAGATQLDHFAPKWFVWRKIKFPFAVVTEIRRCQLTSLQPIRADNFARGEFFDDKVIAELIEWIDIKASRAAYLGRVDVGFAIDLYALVSMFNRVLQEFHRERRPAGLMTGAATTAGFAVEIFVKQHEIAPVRIMCVPRHIAMTWARAFLVRQKDTSQPTGKFTRYFLERHHVSGPGRAFDFERVAIKEMITFKRFDDQEINREPDGTAPV